MLIREIWFDIDGVLNNTPQLGGRPLWIVQEHWDFLRQFPQKLVCVSFHRHWPEKVHELLGVPVLCAAKGHKRDALPADTSGILVIDDQAGEYSGVLVYAVEGKTGLTENDRRNLTALLTAGAEACSA